MFLWNFVHHRRYFKYKLFLSITVFSFCILYYHYFKGVKRYTFPSQYNNSAGEVPLIIRWAPVSGENGARIKCGTNICDVTHNRSRKGEQDIMMYSFYGSNLKPYDLPVPRRQGDIWALIHEESPKNNHYLFSYQDTLGLFNLTSTFKRHSSYPIPTFGLKEVNYILDKTYMLSIEEKNEYRKLGLAPIIYIQSSCDPPSDRDKLVSLLQKYIPIDSYGKCMNNKILPERLSFQKTKSMAPMESEEFFKFVARYKFALAFENAVCDDYVTEKFWRPIHLGVVPIVFGARTIKDFLPDKMSAILTTDFNTVADLGLKLRKLDINDNEYQEYLVYKEHGISNPKLLEFLKMREWGSGTKHWTLFSAFTCFLCNKLHDILKTPDIKYNDVTVDHYGCPAPKLYNSNGQYVKHDPWWKQEWIFAQYLAKATRYFYHKGVSVSESILRTYAKELYIQATKGRH